MPPFVIPVSHDPARLLEVDQQLLKEKKILLFESCTPIGSSINHGQVDRAKAAYINIDSDSYNRLDTRANNRSSRTFFVKNAHSNEWVNLEILAAKLAGLTGLAVPWTILGQGFERNPHLGKQARLRKDAETKGSVPYYFVASQRLKGFRDVSQMFNFVDNYRNELIPKDQHPLFNTLLKELDDLNQNHAELSPPERKIKKRDVMFRIFQLLPKELKDGLEEAYAVSIWLGNWDILNFDLENIGFSIRHTSQGITVEPAIVDFGNCLFAGFGGKYKVDSLENANSPAKKPDQYPDDYDPDIPKEKKIAEKAAGFTEECHMLKLKHIPRRLPFENFLEDIDIHVQKVLDRHKTGDRSVEPDDLSLGFLRGLYRISKISNQAIESTVNGWLWMGDKINWAHPDKTHYTKQDMIHLMQGRRDYMMNHFREHIHYYKTNHRADALEVDREMQQAQVDITGLPFSLGRAAA